MKSRTGTSLARAAVGVFALLLTGAAVGVASPAHAVVGLEYRLIGAPDQHAVEASPISHTVGVVFSNAPTGTAYTLVYDLADVDQDQVVVDSTAMPGNCVRTDNKITCNGTTAEDNAIPYHQYPFTLARKDGSAKGFAGSYGIAVSRETPDTTPANNTATIPVVVVGDGVDLWVEAQDVYQLDGGAMTDKPIPAGGVSAVHLALANFGNRPTSGLKFEVTLPAHVTFIKETSSYCTYATDLRTLTCEYPGKILDPGAMEGGKIPVKVSESAPGPVVLSGGVFSAADMGLPQQKIKANAAAASVKLPANWKPLALEDFEDVDPSDNSDTFAVHVAGVPGGGGSAAPSSSAPAGGGVPGGGSLPVTGDQIGLMAAVGGAVLLVGAALFFTARRRRVVIVVPGDHTTPGI